MKIILLASNPKLYSNQRIIEAARNYGHDIEFINVGDCYIKVDTVGSEVFCHGGRKLTNVDWVIPRIKPAITFYGTAIIRQFEMAGVRCLNSSESIITSRDKLNTLQILAKHKFNIPTTSFANSSYDTKDLLGLVGGAPLVVKLLEGTKGVGVVLVESPKAAESVINAFRSLKADILAQHFIKESKGKDIRCFVIGDQVVASMSRTAQEGEFRANIHLGGVAKTVEITDEERSMAIRAAKILDLQIAGVDLVRSHSGSKILEINSSPGLEGIEGATGIDVAAKMIEYLNKAS